MFLYPRKLDPKHVAFLVKYIPFFSILAFLTPLLRYVRNVPYPEIDTLFTCFFGHAWYPLVNGSGPPGHRFRPESMG